MAIPDTEDKLTALFQAVRDGTVSIVDAVQSIRDAVEVIEDSSFQAGHLEGEKYAKSLAPKSQIYIPQ